MADPRTFAVAIRVYPMASQTDSFLRLFPLLLPVSNSVVTRRSLDKFCLEKRQTRSGWVMNQQNGIPTFRRIRNQKRIVVPITENWPAANEANQVRELGRKFRN